MGAVKKRTTEREVSAMMEEFESMNKVYHFSAIKVVSTSDTPVKIQGFM